MTAPKDMADYLLPLSAMSALAELPRRELRAILGQHTQDGILTVPKECGLFLTRKFFLAFFRIIVYTG